MNTVETLPPATGESPSSCRGSTNRSPPGCWTGPCRRCWPTASREENIDVAWTPGAFEIPTVAGRLAAAGRHAAILCLGAVIRGETTHDQHINRAVSVALAELGARYGLPVLFGVLTCNTLEQAIARSGGQGATTGKDAAAARVGNKGVDCAEAALEMIDLLKKLP